MTNERPAPIPPRPRWVWLPPALALTTGMIDVFGWLSLDRFYTANITGDVTQAVTYAIPGQPFHLLQVLAVPVFLTGLVASYFTIRRFGADRQRVVRILFVAQALLLLVAATAAGAFGPLPWSAGAGRLALGLVAILTISLSNATMSILSPGSPTTWALTANTVRAGVALLNVATGTGSADEREADRRTWRATWPTILSFLVGGVAGVLGLRWLGARAWLVPLVICVLYATMLWRGPAPDEAG